MRAWEARALPLGDTRVIANDSIPHWPAIPLVTFEFYAKSHCFKGLRTTSKEGPRNGPSSHVALGLFASRLARKQTEKSIAVLDALDKLFDEVRIRFEGLLIDVVDDVFVRNGQGLAVAIGAHQMERLQTGCNRS